MNAISTFLMTLFTHPPPHTMKWQLSLAPSTLQFLPSQMTDFCFFSRLSDFESSIAERATVITNVFQISLLHHLKVALANRRTVNGFWGTYFLEVASRAMDDTVV